MIGHPHAIARKARVRPGEEVVGNGDVVDWAGEVQLRAAVLVDAEVVAFDP